MDHTAEIKLDTLRPNDQGDKCRSVTLGSLSGGYPDSIKVRINSLDIEVDENETDLSDEDSRMWKACLTKESEVHSLKICANPASDTNIYVNWFRSNQTLTITTTAPLREETASSNDDEPTLTFGRHEVIFLLDASGSMLNDFGTRTRWSAACEVLKDIAASDTLGLTDIDVGAIITFGGDTAQTIYPDDGELTALSKFSEEFTLPAQPSAWARTPLGRGLARALGFSNAIEGDFTADNADAPIFTDSPWNKRHIFILTDGIHNQGIHPNALKDLIGGDSGPTVRTVKITDEDLPTNYPDFLKDVITVQIYNDDLVWNALNTPLPRPFIEHAALMTALRAQLRDMLGIQTIRSGVARLSHAPDLRTHAFTLSADDAKMQAVLCCSGPVQVALIDPTGALITPPQREPRLPRPPLDPASPGRDPRDWHAHTQGIDVRTHRQELTVTIDLRHRRARGLPTDGRWRLLVFHGMTAEQAHQRWRVGVPHTPLDSPRLNGPAWTYALAVDSTIRLDIERPTRPRLGQALHLQPKLSGADMQTMVVHRSSRPQEPIDAWLDRTDVDPDRLQQIARARPHLSGRERKAEALAQAGRSAPRAPLERVLSPTSRAISIDADQLQHPGTYAMTVRATARGSDGATVERERRIELHLQAEHQLSAEPQRLASAHGLDLSLVQNRRPRQP